MRQALPVLDGTVAVAGLSAPVRVERDSHGIPHIVAANVDDLIFAQGYITADERLWQMDMLRRHSSGRLAEVLGSGMVEHDRTQRFLQMKQAAERALPTLDPGQMHYLQRYAAGVNASMNASIAAGRLQPEFRVLGYQPEPWKPVDSLLVALAMTQDLSTGYPTKFDREAVEAVLPADLAADLYPVGSDRDHPPVGPATQSKGPKKLPQIPEDDERAALRSPEHLRDLLTSQPATACADDCRAGSNNWAVGGTRTASGKPLVANDPHLGLTVPGIWYTADLEAGDFHASGATIPGVPFVVIGHNAHVAWGFTNSGADVQDLYVEQIEGDSFRGADGALHPIVHDRETIVVKRGFDVHIDVQMTQHGGVPTPILSPLYKHERRAVSLRWIAYEPGASSIPLYEVNSAASGAQLVEAARAWNAPSQNLVWGDDAGHVGYHLVGQIPLRGPGGLSGLATVPVPTGSYEWTSFIPYDSLPQVVDPPGGVAATANARIAPDGYPYPLALNWGPPYRNQRIWQVLEANPAAKLTLDDMVRLQNDTVSALDKVFAQKLVYAVDHARKPSKRVRQAAEILRGWDGDVTANSAAAALADVARAELWPMLLEPHLGDDVSLYLWESNSYALERLVTTQPPRWVPEKYADWNELLTAALEKGMRREHAPADLHQWSWGTINQLDLEHPVFGASPVLEALTGARGTGPSPLPGDGSTVRVLSGKHSASMRFIADLANLRGSVLTLPMGQAGDPASPWFMDQWSTWYSGRTVALPFGQAGAAAHTLLLTP